MPFSFYAKITRTIMEKDYIFGGFNYEFKSLERNDRNGKRDLLEQFNN